jgi:hypothetical protein
VYGEGSGVLHSMPSIVCALQVCLRNVKFKSSVHLCRQEYSPSIEVVYSISVHVHVRMYVCVPFI